MTVSITAAVSSSSPPQVSITISSSTALPSAQFTLTRNSPDGRSSKVITSAFPHLTTGTWTGADYHAPFNTAVTYTVAIGSDVATSLPVTLNVVGPWLVHRINPALSLQVLKVMSIGDKTSQSTATTHWPFGAQYPVTISEGVRHARSGTLSVQIGSPADLSKITSLFQDSGPVLINIGSIDGGWWDESWAWVQPGDVVVSNPGSWVYYPTRNVTFSYQVVDTPAGAIIPVWTWATLQASQTSWTSTEATFSSWSNTITNTPG